MSAESKILIIDVGNTSVKWTAFLGDSILWRAQDLHLSIDGSNEFSNFIPELIYFASVRNSADTQKILAYLGVLYRGLPELIQLSSNKNACGIVNPYTEPSRLGIDRWLNVIAVSKLFDVSSVIVDAGTALKIEFIGSQGEYRGGYIAPGFDLMKKMLVTNTGKVNCLDSDLMANDEIITNTGLAVHRGCWQMTLAFVNHVYTQNKAKNFVFTGGAAFEIMKELEIDGSFNADLVALGAKFLGDELVGQR